jgi:hypothetical protein
MKDEQGNSGAGREDLVNALIDGELNEAQIRELTASVDDDRILARTIIEAFQLQQAMAAIPVQRAPASLGKKLRSIPRRQKALARPVFFNPRWAFALAAIPLMAVLVYQSVDGQNTAEVAQGKRDLALALSYFNKTSRRATARIESAIDNGLAVPVTDNTVRTLQNRLEFNREYKL